MERFFSVVVETEDGRTETLRLSGATPGVAFQQAKATPGVRRVGKVAEVNSRTGPDPVRASGSHAGGPTNRPQHEQSRPASPGRTERAAGYDPKVGFVLTGPRVVIHARPTGGEQPFRNLQAPPEQFGPPKSLFLVALKAEEERQLREAEAERQRQAEEAARLAAAAAEQARAAEAAKRAVPSEPQYRIYKSRRRDGLPYLLQRGTWRDAGGKRLFEAGWEKGFAERDQAERHLAWLAQNEREIAEVGHAGGDGSAAEADDDDADGAELEHADADMDCQLA